jgi:hypothetical protein
MGLFSSIFGAIGANQAGNTLNNAGKTGQANIDASAAAGQGLIAGGEQGVSSATGQGQAGVSQATGAGQNAVTTAASGTAPYLSAGNTGATMLQNYAASNPNFSFQPTQQQLESTPGYQFQLAQGQNAIQNTAAASGLNQSGAALKELTQYGQGLAGTYYQNAFNNAQQTFQTNQNATLANLSTLSNIGQTANAQNIGAQEYQSGMGQQGAEAEAGMGQQGAEAEAGMGQQGAEAAAGLGEQGALANLSGTEASANLGLQGQEAATNSLLTGAQGKAAGQMGMWNGIGNTLNAGAEALFPGSGLF